MLRKGQRFSMGGKLWRVEYVNASRAHCVTSETRIVTVRGRSFTAHQRRYIDISPNAGVDVMQSLEAR